MQIKSNERMPSTLYLLILVLSFFVKNYHLVLNPKNRYKSSVGSLFENEVIRRKKNEGWVPRSQSKLKIKDERVKATHRPLFFYLYWKHAELACFYTYFRACLSLCM